ncbi:MAG: DUF5615 family PIN-like protein [Thermoguttaceae bacterium]
MRFKTDENLHEDVAESLRRHGHDAVSVFEEGLRGHADPDIAGVETGTQLVFAGGSHRRTIAAKGSTPNN